MIMTARRAWLPDFDEQLAECDSIEFSETRSTSHIVFFRHILPPLRTMVFDPVGMHDRQLPAHTMSSYDGLWIYHTHFVYIDIY